MRSLGELTDGRFRDGAVARVLAMEFWTRGEGYAYLTDLKHKRAGSDWKSLRRVPHGLMSDQRGRLAANYANPAN